MLPLQRELNIYSVRLPLLHSSPLPLFVDTGSPYILLPPEIVTELHPEKTPPVFDVANLAGETFEVQAFLLPQFKIGNIQEPQVVVYATKGLPVPAILGMNFLSRFRVTLDLRHRQMWLERASDYHKRLTLPGLPCILATEQEGLIVDVLSGCAAEKAGIQKGDKILRVDGQEVKTLSFSSLSTLLNGLAGTQAEIIVERARVQKPPIRFIRQSLFAMPNGRGSGVGINAGMSPTGKLLITAIERHSPAEEAELQTGDEIVAVNGFKVGTASLERIIAETKQPEGTKIILIIQHPGEDKPREIKLKVRKLL